VSDPEKFKEFFKNFPVPEDLPTLSTDIKNKILQIGKKNPRIKLNFKNIKFYWLDPTDNRLGTTIFSDDLNELTRKRILNLPLGKTVIKLHPILLDDEKLYNHTMVHELLHAFGLIEHSKEHSELTNKVAPAPSLSESNVLRYLQAVMISSTGILSWNCDFCGHVWTRNTVKKPRYCPKCRSLFR
tara:strand:+ start:3263 stop:3817 length:555 start_codon:yes stop_codon:yes gene_type:complete